jgi:glycosyltransferase involved in cell wall biosynthesis
MKVLAWPIRTPWNPYTGLVHSHLGPGVEVDGWPGNPLRKYDVWHVHWPDSLLGIPSTVHATYKVSGLYATVDFLRARGTKVIWTMHNFASHEARHPRLEAWFWRRFIPRVDGAISLTSTGLAMGLERFPRLKEVPSVVIPHGHYRAQYPEFTGDARAALGIAPNAKVLLFFGAVRAYKNVDVLIRAFRGVKRDDAILYIAGNPNATQLTARIRKEAELDKRVTLKFEFIDEKDVAKYFSAADLVVLPYREVLNSGSALLALSCNRPVLVPDRGAMGELKSEFSETWVRTFPGEIDSATLETAIDWASEPRAAICQMPAQFDWLQIGHETAAFYRRVVAGSPAYESVSRVPAEDRSL